MLRAEAPIALRPMIPDAAAIYGRPQECGAFLFSGDRDEVYDYGEAVGDQSPIPVQILLIHMLDRLLAGESSSLLPVGQPQRRHRTQPCLLILTPPRQQRRCRLSHLTPRFSRSRSC